MYLTIYLLLEVSVFEATSAVSCLLCHFSVTQIMPKDIPGLAKYVALLVTAVR